MSKKLAIAMFGQKRLSREGGVEIVVKELCTRMAQNGCDVTCYNRAGHHVSGAEYDDAGKTEYEGIRQKSVPTIERRGPASFIMPLQIGKTPIVVPRQHQFNEHVNDHQVEFARNVAQRMGTIIPVEDIETLGDIITNYDRIVAGVGHGMSSNNERFNKELEKLVEKMMEEGK